MKKSVVFLALVGFSLPLCAQYRSERYDTAWYVSYRDRLTLGILGLKKNTVFKTDASTAENALRFRSNSPGRLGISASYDFLGLSASFGAGRLDPSYSKEKGSTKQANLQLTVTGRKILADIYFQQYKGLYFQQGPTVYTRPDIATGLYGTTVSLIHNNRRFTAQAPFLLDGRQKRSAGSLLYGGEFFYGSARGDSAFVPAALASEYPHAEVRKIDFVSFGPGMGYGYTLVLKSHFFLTGLASFHADASYIREWNESSDIRRFWKFNPNLKAKGAIGYNAENWGLGLSYTSNRLFFKALEGDARYLNYNDNYKLMYTRRLPAGKTVPKVVGFAGRVINAVGLGFLIN